MTGPLLISQAGVRGSQRDGRDDRGYGMGIPVIADRGLTAEEIKTYGSVNGERPFIETEHDDLLEAHVWLQQLAAEPEKAREIGPSFGQFVEKHLKIDETSEIAYKILSDLAPA